MGNVQSSKNYLDNVTETISRVIQENGQTCKATTSQINEIKASGNCKIELHNVDINQLIGVDFTCLQKADLTATIASQMNVQLEQLAKSLLSGLRFDIASSQDATNFITNHVRLVTEVINRMTQDCGVAAGQYNGFVCGDNGSILVTDSTVNQTINAVYKCSQEGETIADIKTSIEQFIKQTAISENKGLSFDLLLIALGIVVVVIVIVILNKALDWKFLAIGVPVVAIIIYLCLAAQNNWWPFKSKFDDKNKKPTPPTPQPPAPKAVQDYLASQRQIGSDQASPGYGASTTYWGRQMLGMTRKELTPSQYRRLKYGDDSIAFERPYEKKPCGVKVKPVRLAMKLPEPIIV